MSAINFSKMLAEHPLPAFAAPGDMAQVTILGVSYTIHSPRAVATSEDFKIFGDLPKEIQTKIWGFADVGRVITITEKPKRKLVQASTGLVLSGPLLLTLQLTQRLWTVLSSTTTLMIRMRRRRLMSTTLSRLLALASRSSSKSPRK